MSSPAQKPLLADEFPALQIVQPAPALLINWPSGWQIFLDNLADYFRPEPPALRLTSAPARFWADVFVHRPLGKKNFVISFIYHGGIVSFLYLISILPAYRAVPQAAPARTPLTFFKVSEYLPEIHSAPPVAKTRIARKGVPALAKQEVISIPERPDNREQTMIDPASIRLLPKPVSLPNMTGALPVPPSPKSDALRAPKITFNIPQPQVVAPAAQSPQRQLSKLKLPDVPAPSIVPPPPTPDEIKRKLGDLNIAAPAVAVEAPPLPVEEQRASGNPEATAAAPKAATALPPAPAVPAGLGGNGAANLLALSLRPAVVEGPIEMPGGNRSGEFAASPNGRPDAPGTPDVKASNVNDNAAAKRGSGNGADKNAAGLDVTVGPPPAGAPVGENGGLIVQSPPLATKLAEPQQVATLTRPKINQIPENTNPEEAVFGGKRSYSLSLNMPNLASAGGSWVIRFAELAEDPAPGDLSAPVAIEKVDPKYPASMMRDGVEGSVTLYAVIRSDGSVGEVKVLRSLNDQLDENARAALAQWRFRPATKNGAPVDLEAVVTIPFKARALPF